MENYIISNNTIALIKKGKLTIAYEVNKRIVIYKRLKSIINYNCKYYGSTVEGRIKSVKSILNIKYKIPIIISENNDIIMCFLNNSRKNTSILMNLKYLLNYELDNNKLLIKCLNNNNFYVDTTPKKLEKLIVSNFIINNVIKSRKKY